MGKRKTDEERVRELQGRIDKRKKKAEIRKRIEDARKELTKL